MKLRKMSAKDELLIGQKSVSSSSSASDSAKYRENFAHLGQGSSSSSSGKANNARNQRSVSPVRGVKRHTPRKRSQAIDLKRALKETGLARAGSRLKSELENNTESPNATERGNESGNPDNNQQDAKSETSHRSMSNSEEAKASSESAIKPTNDAEVIDISS